MTYSYQWSFEVRRVVTVVLGLFWFVNLKIKQHPLVTALLQMSTGCYRMFESSLSAKLVKLSSSVREIRFVVCSTFLPHLTISHICLVISFRGHKQHVRNQTEDEEQFRKELMWIMIVLIFCFNNVVLCQLTAVPLWYFVQMFFNWTVLDLSVFHQNFTLFGMKLLISMRCRSSSAEENYWW